MISWELLWTVLWYGGLGLFAILSVIITIRGWKDLRHLLSSVRGEKPRGR